MYHDALDGHLTILLDGYLMALLDGHIAIVLVFLNALGSSGVAIVQQKSGTGMEAMSCGR